MATPNEHVFLKCTTLNCQDNPGLQDYDVVTHLLYKMNGLP